MSGVGRELGEPALNNYLELKTVIVKMSNWYSLPWLIYLLHKYEYKLIK